MIDWFRHHTVAAAAATAAVLLLAVGAMVLLWPHRAIAGAVLVPVAATVARLRTPTGRPW
jgi:hypothetical protein